MKTEKRFITRWGIFAEKFETIGEAIARANKAIENNECLAAVVETEKSVYADGHRWPTTETTRHYTAYRSITELA